MNKVAIIGPIDELGQRTISSGLGKEFEVVTITSEAEYFEKLRDVDYVVLRTLTLNRQSIDMGTRLKLIQRWGVGYDSVDVVWAGRKGIPVAVLPGINSGPVAEYTVLLMLSAMRNLVNVHNNIAQGLFRDDSLTKRSYIISGKTVGLVGLGSIGKRVAHILQSFGAQIIYYDKYRLSAEQEEQLGITYAALDKLAAVSDILSLHIPLTDDTYYLVNREFIAAMKPTAVLINTARGEIIEEQALFEALRDGKLLAAGLDVFAQEPLAQGHPLTTLSNVVLSAHCAGNTIDNSVLMGEFCVANILAIHQGLKLKKPILVNEEYLS